ncbi:unnamed protein product, partial [Mesorhabditis belari]|uniref:Equilibrative nucleoside transporter 3 n=1 Tax=Mesorhabditis belari TaxID=2138241 RepID=A0AAF3FI87_9BILA
MPRTRNGYVRVPCETDWMLEKEEPRDSLNLVYFIALLNGIGVLLPWNMFITIAPQYYVEYWFTQNGTTSEYADSFMSWLGLASQIPNVSVNILNIILVISGSLLIRIVGPLVVNCFCISAVIGIVIFCAPTLEGMAWFYAVTMFLVIVINTANGIYQNSIFGLFADFPSNYTNAIVLGNNICGTFTAVLSIFCTIVLNDIRMVAMIYFSISFAVLIACLASIVLLKRSPFFTYFESKGEATREASNSTKPSWSQIQKTIQHAWPQFLNVFMIFLVTLSIFPAMLTASPPLRGVDGGWVSLIPENIYGGVIIFLNFNVFATIGSFVAGLKQWPNSNYLWVAVWLRVLFMPFFMFYNYLPHQRTLPVLFYNEWVFGLGNSLMAFSSGYLSSLAMMYAPKVVPEALSKTAGMISSLCLIAGIASGVIFTFIIQFIVTHL